LLSDKFIDRASINRFAKTVARLLCQTKLLNTKKMKSLLYVAAALMIGASIYGFVDYSKANHHKEFEAMYDDKETKDPVKAEEGTGISGIITVVNKKNEAAVIKKELGKEETGAGATNLLQRLGRKIKKKRSVDYKSFSRAPLREEVVILPEIKDHEVKEQ
jgi:hypothetical protein